MPKSLITLRHPLTLTSPSLLCAICLFNNLWGWGLQGEDELDLVRGLGGGPRDAGAWGPV